MGSFLRGSIGALLLAAFLASIAEARQWTDRNGRTVSANYVRVDGSDVILQQGNKVLRVPFDSLSDADQEFVKKQNGGKQPVVPNPQPIPNPAGAPALNPPNPGPMPAASPLTAERTWTDVNGKTVQGRFDRMVGDSMLGLRINGQPVVLPLANFSEADRKFLVEQGVIKSADVGPPVGLPQPGDPLAGLRWYPSEENMEPLGPPRWWHWADKAVFGSVIRVNSSATYFLAKGDNLPALQSFDSMAPSEARAILELLTKAGRQPLIAKIIERNSQAGPGREQATEHGLAEAELNVSETRNWYNGFDLIRGNMTKVTDSLIYILDDAGKEHHLGVGYAGEGDNTYVMAFLERHKLAKVANAILEKRAANPH